MPTRYTLDVDLKAVVAPEAIESAAKKTDARKVRGSSVLKGRAGGGGLYGGSRAAGGSGRWGAV